MFETMVGAAAAGEVLSTNALRPDAQSMHLCASSARGLTAESSRF